MSQQPNTRGGVGRGVGSRGGTRGGRGGRGGGQGPPLAAQVRQLERELGPEEPRLLSRYAPIGACRIRSEYGPGGLLLREVGRLNASSAIEYISVADAELLLALHHRAEESARLEARRASRLPIERREVPLTQLSEEEMRILRMSNAVFQRFRASQGTEVPAMPDFRPAPSAPEQGPQ